MLTTAQAYAEDEFVVIKTTGDMIQDRACGSGRKGAFNQVNRRRREIEDFMPRSAEAPSR
jgi:hypothetical protein